MSVFLAGFLVSLPLVFQFDPAKDFQFDEKAAVDSLPSAPATTSASTAWACCW